MIGREREPAGRIPAWMHADRERVRALVDMRSGGDAEAWLEWEAVVRLATGLDVLAAYPEWEGGVAATAWQVACWLSERLPEPSGSGAVVSSLHAVVFDLDNNAVLRESLGDAAAALAASLTAPSDADRAALRADIAATVAGTTPLLAEWELHGERGARTLRKMRTTQGPPQRPA